MASSKDTFESHTWRANTFAAGAWRGVGVTAVSVIVPGAEYSLDSTRMHYSLHADERMHYRLDNGRLHYNVPEEGN